MSHGKQIKIGSILSYISIVVNILAGLIYTPWMIKKIGDSQYGLYTLANSIITLFLVDFGLSSAVSRYVSKYNAEGDQEKVNNFLGVVYKLYLIIDTAIFIILFVYFFMIDSIYVKLTPAELEQFKVVYIISASFAVCNFPFVTLNGILTAYEQFIPLKLADVIYRVLLVGLTVTALLLGMGLYALVIVHAIAGIAIIVYKYIVIKIKVPVKVHFKYNDKSLYKDIFGFSIWTTISSLAQRLIFLVTPSILGIVANSSAIALFGVVSTIEGYVFTVTSAINGMFMPKISRIYADKEEEKDVTPLLMRVGKFQFALNGLLVVGFAVIGKPFISLWMDASYLDVYYGVLLVIIPGIFFNALQIGNTAMIVLKKVNWLAWINLIVGIINVSFSFILSYYLGMLGACISIFIAYMVRAILLNIVYYKKLKLNMPLFAKECYLKMALPLLLSLGMALVIAYYIPEYGWWSLIAEGIIAVILYLVLMLFLGIKKEERKSIFCTVNKLFHK